MGSTIQTERARLRLAALQWGAVGLCVLVYLAATWVFRVIEEALVLICTNPGARVLADRVSQMKPAPFKFPWTGVYLTLFLLSGLAAVGGLVWWAVRDARATDDRVDLP